MDSDDDLIAERMQQAVVVDRILEVINRAIKHDDVAIRSLLMTRITCTKDLAEDSEIPVRDHQDGTYSISPLGLLSGVAGVDKTGYSNIEAIFELFCSTHGTYPIRSAVHKPVKVSFYLAD